MHFKAFIKGANLEHVYCFSFSGISYLLSFAFTYASAGAMYVQYIWILERRLPGEDLDPISVFTSVTDILFFFFFLPLLTMIAAWPFIEKAKR